MGPWPCSDKKSQVYCLNRRRNVDSAFYLPVFLVVSLSKWARLLGWERNLICVSKVVSLAISLPRPNAWWQDSSKLISREDVWLSSSSWAGTQGTESIFVHSPGTEYRLFAFLRSQLGPMAPGRTGMVATCSSNLWPLPSPICTQSCAGALRDCHSSAFSHTQGDFLRSSENTIIFKAHSLPLNKEHMLSYPLVHS